jgi:hypothetical protein
VPGETAPSTNVVAGLVDGRRFRAFEYAHRLQVVMIELKQALPFVEVTPRVLTAEATDGAADVHLESEEFDRRFRVRANDSRYAVAILHPQLMDVLLAGPELSWRILGRDLVAWEPGSLDPRGIKPALGLLESIRDAIPTFVWHDYGKSAEHVP